MLFRSTTTCAFAPRSSCVRAASPSTASSSARQLRSHSTSHRRTTSARPPSATGSATAVVRVDVSQSIRRIGTPRCHVGDTARCRRGGVGHGQTSRPLDAARCEHSRVGSRPIPHAGGRGPPRRGAVTYVGGEVVKSTGDGALCAFPTVDAALARCCRRRGRWRAERDVVVRSVVQGVVGASRGGRGLVMRPVSGPEWLVVRVAVVAPYCCAWQRGQRR
jgi:hypothetical protein